MKKTLTIIGLAVATLAGAQAQYSFTSIGQTITETFTNYSGTAAPTNWTLTSVNRVNGNGTAVFQGNIGSASSVTGGWRSYGVTSPSNAADRSLGFLGNGNFGGGNGNGAAANNDLNFATMTASYTNNTGASLTSLSISYKGEQWLAQASRSSLITVAYSLDGTSFTDIPSLTFNAPNTTAGGVLDGNASGNSTTFSAATVSATVPASGSFFVRFSYNGGGGTGSRQGLSIDDVAVTAIPEPAAVALFAFAGLAFLVYRARARSRGVA